MHREEFEVRYTQAKPNCWQVSAAAILGVPVEELPDQVKIEEAGKSFNNALLAYLRRHHDKTFVVVEEGQRQAPLRVDPDAMHIIIGETERTPRNGNLHAVVGRGGELLHDPHPSRAGLTKVKDWHFIVPLWDTRRDYYNRWDPTCLCPACGGVKLQG